jgi:hypothetical protein
MNYLIPILVCIAVAATSYYLGLITKPRVTKDDIISSMKVEFVNKLHPLVIIVYKLFISKEDIKYFSESEHNILITCIDVSIWASNSVYNRQFTNIPLELLKEYNCTLKELNNSLSLADKKILDHIVQAIKINNKEFIDRIFI